MPVHRGTLPADLTKQRTAVAVGTFDGVHVGHAAILAALQRVADEHGIPPIVATFDPHPRSLVDGELRQISMLYSFEERVALFQEHGIEHIFVLEFTEAMRQLSPRSFLEDYVLRRWNAGYIVAGYNHSFGKDRQGDRESLIGMGRELGLSVEIAQPVLVADQPVSSTVIRKLLFDGNIPLANQMLGKLFSVTGRVIRGFGRGRRMGCPTANLNGFAAHKLIPRDGIYAAQAEVNGLSYPAAVSIGFNPTFGNQVHSLEAHILGLNEDLYDRQITVRFVKRLRGEQKFSGEESLSQQMQRDIEDIKGILESEGLDLEPTRIAEHQNINKKNT
ncbi:MAG: bifunctional riboflavin kinase/FAD synthetase [bacterium]|nr:bifunctional riboflavin kinase/FAD synthetase [bacterium]